MWGPVRGQLEKTLATFSEIHNIINFTDLAAVTQLEHKRNIMKRRVWGSLKEDPHPLHSAFSPGHRKTRRQKAPHLIGSYHIFPLRSTYNDSRDTKGLLWIEQSSIKHPVCMLNGQMHAFWTISAYTQASGLLPNNSHILQYITYSTVHCDIFTKQSVLKCVSVA